MEIVPRRLARGREIDRQDVAAHLRRLVQDAVRQDLVVAANLARDPAQHDTVHDAERVVGDDDQRTGGGHIAARRAVERRIQIQRRDGILPEQLRRPAQRPIVVVQPADAPLAGAALDEPNDAPAHEADLIGGVAEFGRKIGLRRERTVDRAADLDWSSHARCIAQSRCSFVTPAGSRSAEAISTIPRPAHMGVAGPERFANAAAMMFDGPRVRA